jgi:hypothetical protein
MIISSYGSAAGAEVLTQTNVEFLNSPGGGPTTPTGKALIGGSRKTRRSTLMTKARLYRLTLTAGVVAVFVEGLGAGMKWY